MPTRCFIPPESSRGYALSKPSSPTRSIALSARRVRAKRSTARASSPISTFSITVNHGRRANDWNTIATSGLGPVNGLPSLVTRPLVNGMRPAMIRNSVLFPLPLRPSSATTSPRPTVTLTSCNARNVPFSSAVGKVFEHAWTSINVSVIDGTFVAQERAVGATRGD